MEFGKLKKDLLWEALFSGKLPQPENKGGNQDDIHHDGNQPEHYSPTHLVFAFKRERSNGSGRCVGYSRGEGCPVAHRCQSDKCDDSQRCAQDGGCSWGDQDRQASRQQADANTEDDDRRCREFPFSWDIPIERAKDDQRHQDHDGTE